MINVPPPASTPPFKFHPNVVSPSNNRIHPSATSFGVSVLGLASWANAGAATKNRAHKEVIRRMAVLLSNDPFGVHE
jgi:hypothetical protein